ncbi:MAG: hypothetical protein V2B18_04450 [Pseudomonadota bacterium]
MPRVDRDHGGFDAEWNRQKDLGRREKRPDHAGRYFRISAPF